MIQINEKIQKMRMHDDAAQMQEPKTTSIFCSKKAQQDDKSTCQNGVFKNNIIRLVRKIETRRKAA